MNKFQIESDGNKGIPIFSWCEDIEESALAQIANLAQLPFAYHHIAILSDCHAGYGMPIGGVLATKGVIIPNAVGVDVGCGMVAMKTSLTDISQEEIKTLFGGTAEHHGGIRELIPVGFNHQDKKCDESEMPTVTDELVVSAEYESARKQLGSLGGGNHFLEIQKGSDGFIWVMIHSGSRNLGLQVAKHYNIIARHLNEKYFSAVPLSYDLAFLPLDSTEGQAYIKEMNYCVEFANRNRHKMMKAVMGEMENMFSGIMFDGILEAIHNYASIENHYGENVWVHRKGATLARKGTVGIIPGSQGTFSYIVEGLGNPESFMSCSHGAGRKMSRTKAIAELDLQEEIKKMDGIVHGIRNQKDLDEAAGSYKDIKSVMEQQKNLVKVLVELKPLGVVKG